LRNKLHQIISLKPTGESEKKVCKHTDKGFPKQNLCEQYKLNYSTNVYHRKKNAGLVCVRVSVCVNFVFDSFANIVHINLFSRDLN